jgi:NAD(P)-dependent dehydrogenase (short-subunit alcohol dehydrogenase family)
MYGQQSVLIHFSGVRNVEAARKSVESYIDSSLWMNKVIYEKCDVGDMTSVRQFAKCVQEQCRAINLLINNGNYQLSLMNMCCKSYLEF